MFSFAYFYNGIIGCDRTQSLALRIYVIPTNLLISVVTSSVTVKWSDLSDVSSDIPHYWDYC